MSGAQSPCQSTFMMVTAHSGRAYHHCVTHASPRRLPTFAICNVCCSMASCIIALSASRMHSNSSMQHSPPSASTSAPASRLQAPPSFIADTVRPAPARHTHTLHGQNKHALAGRKAFACARRAGCCTRIAEVGMPTNRTAALFAGSAEWQSQHTVTTMHSNWAVSER